MFDLCWSDDSIPEWRAEVDSLYEEIWAAYAGVIRQLSRANRESVDWWVTPVASRNEYKDPLFHYCCGLAVLRKKIGDGVGLETVLVDNKEIGDIVQRYFDLIGYPALVQRRMPGLMVTVRNRWASLKQKLGFFRRIILVRLSCDELPSYPNQLVLIDTFSIPGCEAEDRYYGSFYERLSAEDRQRVRWVPHFVGLHARNTAAHLGKLLELGRKYIIKEKLLGFTDYFFIWFHLNRVRRLKVPELYLFEFRVSELVRRLIRSPWDIEESFSGLLNYRFARRLQQLQAKPVIIIDWFENQPVDKGWNLGFRSYFPEVHTIGYQGSYSDQPRDRLSREEINAGAGPEEIRVMGRGLMPPDTEVVEKDLKWSISPAFRYEWLSRHRISSDEQNVDSRVILVLLPIETLTARYLVDCVAEAADRLESGVEFQVKPHPASSRELLDYCKAVNKHNFEVLSDVLNLRDDSSHVVICGGISTTPLEALAIGKKLVFIEVPGYRHQTPRLKVDAGENYVCVENSAGLVQVLNEDSLWHQSTDAISIAGKIKEMYFEPVTEKGVREFVT